MRLAQYAITAFGDSGELVVFSGIGGTPKAIYKDGRISLKISQTQIPP